MTNFCFYLFGLSLMLASGRCTLRGGVMPRTMYGVCLFVFCFYRPAAPVCVICAPREVRVLFFLSVPHVLSLLIGRAFRCNANGLE